MNPIKKTSLDSYTAGTYDRPLKSRINPDAEQKILFERSRNNQTASKKDSKKNSTTQVVNEMKIALQKEGLGNYIDLMA